MNKKSDYKEDLNKAVKHIALSSELRKRKRLLDDAVSSGDSELIKHRKAIYNAVKDAQENI